MSLSSYQSHYPFEFCAARFLRQWERREEGLFNEISATPTDSAIIDALRYFQVARNFPGLSEDKEAAGKIRTALCSVRSDLSLAEPVDKVNALATSLERDFDQFNLSAATKLLWLSFREPFVVYDKRAVSALSKHGKHKNVAGNYLNYTLAWRAEYVKLEAEIGVAIANLPNGRAFMPRTLLSDAELNALAGKSWFKERVFDIFLWEVGGDG